MKLFWSKNSKSKKNEKPQDQERRIDVLTASFEKSSYGTPQPKQGESKNDVKQKADDQKAINTLETAFRQVF